MACQQTSTDRTTASLAAPRARPQTMVAGQPGARFDLAIELIEGRRHLPVVLLKRAA